MPYRRNFRGAGGRSDQCSVKARLNRKVLSLDLKTDRNRPETTVRSYETTLAYILWKNSRLLTTLFCELTFSFFKRSCAFTLLKVFFSLRKTTWKYGYVKAENKTKHSHRSGRSRGNPFHYLHPVCQCELAPPKKHRQHRKNQICCH